MRLTDKTAAGPELELELEGRVEINTLTADAADMVHAVVEQALSRLEHGALPGRGEQGQHPVAAIEGLSGELARIPEPAEALTNFELEEILK